MILFDTVTRRLRVLLGGAGVIPGAAHYIDISTTTQGISNEAVTPFVTNGATPVDAVPVPGASTRRQLKHFWLRNSTGAAVTATVRYDDNGTSYDLVFTLDAGDTLQYTDGHGWSCITSAGESKSSGTGGGSALTVEEVDGAPSVVTVSKIKFAQADGLTVTDEGGGVARVNSSGTPAPDQDARIYALLMGD